MKRLTCAIIIAITVLPVCAQSSMTVTKSGRNDVSAALAEPKEADKINEAHSPDMIQSASSVEQTEQGTRPAAEIVASFDGLGFGFEGPQGTAMHRNPSDNSLAVGPDHIMQTVNSKMAIFTKKGKRYDSTGVVLYGPVNTNNVFKGFGGPCEEMNNGDAVVRYDQLAGRWLIVMPIFRKVPPRDNEPEAPLHGEPARLSMAGNEGQPGKAEKLYIPEKESPEEQATADSIRRTEWRRRPRIEEGSYCMCYAISTGPDPFGPYYRYEFVRPLFPDYPRPAVWPDGYYVPTSTGDHVIQKHACVVERKKMLEGQPAREICFVIDSVGFLNNADLDGYQLPPEGDPNIMMATGGAQLKNIFGDDGIYYWKFRVDWKEPSKSKLDGPHRIDVAEYNYLGNGQLTRTVPQPGTDEKLDSQGDKIMSRLVYRRIGDQESIVAVHSVNTSAGGGGVRWYEFRLDDNRDVKLFQQGTYAPDNNYRWMGSPAMDKYGNIGIGYSYGGASHFPGQRFAGRLACDPTGLLTLRESVLVNGEASQTNTMRWMDYAQTAVDPDDDWTIWYVGDYLKEGAENYSTRIGGFRITNEELRMKNYE
ncbi:MAG: hypothetical protein JW965_01085 [Bacteroidales bacterium]|nr:hypothetical protein [Bacteroidales bacterium]